MCVSAKDIYLVSPELYAKNLTIFAAEFRTPKKHGRNGCQVAEGSSPRDVEVRLR